MIITHTASVEKLQRLKNYFQFYFVLCLNKMNISAGLLLVVQNKLLPRRHTLIIILPCVLFHCRHMLNVTWENNDFSFNSNGYLVNPAMIIITLDRERQWDKVSFSYNT